MQSLPPIIFTRFSGNDDDDHDDDDDVCLCLSPRPAAINRRLAGHSIVDDYLGALSRCAGPDCLSGATRAGVSVSLRVRLWLRVSEQEEAGARCQTK
jgi:hypothetical protein